MKYEYALELATKLHKGQKRKYSGLDYITHPVAVAESLPEHYRVVAVLHDVIEDTHMTIMELVNNHGLSKREASVLELLTYRQGQTYTNYIRDIGRNEFATKVKIADIIHNMSDLTDRTLHDKYELSLYILSH